MMKISIMGEPSTRPFDRESQHKSVPTRHLTVAERVAALFRPQTSQNTRRVTKQRSQPNTGKGDVLIL
jgi:hypothetical protein